MLILEEPFVSDLLRTTVATSGSPVLETEMARRELAGLSVSLSSSSSFARLALRPGARLYTNSENAVAWVHEYLAESEISRRVASFKDKVAFRELVKPLFPDLFFQEVRPSDLGSIDTATLPMPCVVKPATGFFSVGVHRIEARGDWEPTVARLLAELEHARGLYPESVLDLERLIIEEAIEGEEIAIDAYYDGGGEPVVVGVLGHLFSGADDVSDRVYVSSASLVEQRLPQIDAFLRELGGRAELQGFPLHAEVRISAAGDVVPIEVNPLRFGGWCACDITWHAFGINPYTAYLEDLRPNWPRLCDERRDRTTALVVANFPVDLDRTAIQRVDYAGFERRFSRPLELRRLDYRRYPVFAFLFVEVADDDTSELDWALTADLTEFLELSPPR